MKYHILLPLIALLALPVFAQESAKIDAAISGVFSGTGQPSNTDGGNNISTLARGIYGLNGVLALKTDTSQNIVIPSTTVGSAFTHKFVFSAPSENRTITFTNASGTVALNPLAGTLEFEGDTADAFELLVEAVDPTADGTIWAPDLGVGLADTNVSLVLSTIDSGLNAPGLATAVWTGVSSVVFEGATADAHEAVLDAADVTADVIYRLPDAAAATYGIVPSSLATNGVGAANSVTGTSNGFVAEGATADTSETTLSFADATADTTQTVPAAAASGTVCVISAAQVEAATDTLTAGQLYGGLITNAGAGGAAVYTLPAPVVGMQFTVVLTDAQDVDINPADGTQILTLTNATGDAISSAAAIGNFITLRAVSSTQWIATESSGTWSDAN